MCFSQEGCGHFTRQDGRTAGIQLPPWTPQPREHRLGAWQLVPGPPHLAWRPCLLPLRPVAMGTSILQLTEQLTWCLFFSFCLGPIFAFISWALSLRPSGAQSRGEGHLFGIKWRLQTPKALRRHPRFCSPPLPGSTSKLHSVP